MDISQFDTSNLNPLTQGNPYNNMNGWQKLLAGGQMARGMETGPTGLTPPQVGGQGVQVPQLGGQGGAAGFKALMTPGLLKLLGSLGAAGAAGGATAGAAPSGLGAAAALA